MKIVSSRYADLPPDQRAYLENIAEEQFGHIPLVRETTWAEPDWAYLGYQGEKLVVFHNVILRSVSIDGAATRIAGLNNMITLPGCRGQGFASRLLRETQPEWFDRHGAQRGMLLCADELVPFYARLGWRRVDVPVRYEQPSGALVWAASCMVLDAAEAAMPRQEVKLCGLPW